MKCLALRPQGYILSLLGLPEKAKLPAAGMQPRDIGGLIVWVEPLSPGRRGKPHRVLAYAWKVPEHVPSCPASPPCVHVLRPRHAVMSLRPRPPDAAMSCVPGPRCGHVVISPRGHLLQQPHRRCRPTFRGFSATYIRAVPTKRRRCRRTFRFRPRQSIHDVHDTHMLLNFVIRVAG